MGMDNNGYRILEPLVAKLLAAGFGVGPSPLRSGQVLSKVRSTASNLPAGQAGQGRQENKGFPDGT